MKIVILAGGAGTRLWPMSTDKQPKQFQKLVSARTMIQETFDRVNFVDPKDIYVSTNAKYVELVKEQLPEIPEENIIGEPSRQDSGPCMGLVAALIAKKDPEAVIAMISSDHLVQDVKEFQHKLKVTAEIAKRDKTLNIIEVKAKSPNVNLGYVQIGKQLTVEDGVEVYEFKDFKEKPDLETAKRFVASHSYLWNTGYYVWRADVILEAFKAHMPQTYEQLMAIQAGGDINELYPKCEKISVDYGIMEKVDPAQVRIIPADLGWSDIGTWASLHEELVTEPKGSLIKGNVFAFECEGCVIYNETDTPLNVFGLTGMVVVQTKDQTFSCPLDKSHELKKMLNAKSNTN
ncbi:MAG: mannose-1-phosphate guanylyltransferase [Oceanicoccus sp.]|jgi:mannose-1-phosphate guanylyltransferase